MKEKFSRIRAPWRRTVITASITIMLILDHLMSSGPGRAHWVGHRANKPNRLAFYFFAAVIIAGHVVARDHMLWAVAWGSAFSLFVIYRSLIIIVRHLSYT